MNTLLAFSVVFSALVGFIAGRASRRHLAADLRHAQEAQRLLAEGDDALEYQRLHAQK